MKTPQLSFDDLRSSADDANLRHVLERETGHLPDRMEEALPFFRKLTEDHHAAMLRADVAEVMRLRNEAERLTLRLNRGEPGILADDDAPGRVLERETAAPTGALPLWGQKGAFDIAVNRMRVHIGIGGMFCIGSCFGLWPGFSAHAIDPDAPFLSETSYRSFIGVSGEAQPGLTPEMFAREGIAAYVESDLKGRLVAIEARYKK